MNSIYQSSPHTPWESDLLQQRIDRITYLICRLEIIENELDEIHAAIFGKYLTRKKFFDMVTRRNNLLIEQANREKDLRENYRMLDLEEEDEEWL